MAKVEVRVGNGEAPGSKRMIVLLEDEPRVAADLDAQFTSGLIDMLAVARMALTPSVPVKLAPGTPLTGIKEPNWQIEWLPDGSAMSLSLRHPGFGWVSFGLSPTSMERLRAGLSIPPPTTISDVRPKQTN